MFNGPVFLNETIQANARAVNAGGISESLDKANALYSRLSGASFELVPSSFKGGTLYSGAPGVNGDLTWTRGSDAFRTNASGLIQRVPWNLLSWSEDFSNVIWSKDAGVTVDSNVDLAPNGTTTADRLNLSTNGAVYRSGMSLGTGSFTLSVWLKGEGANIGKQVLLELSNGNSTVTLTGDWQRFTTTGTNVINVAIKRLTSGQASAVLAWGIQIVEGTTAQTYLPTTDRLNFPRLSYMYGSCPSVLLEPQRTNVFQNSGWTGGGSVPTSWSSFITGSTTAVTSIKNISISAYRFSATNQRAFFVQSLTTTIGTTYSVSFYCESITTTQTIQDTISGGTPVAYYKNGVSISSTANLEAGNFYTYTLLATIVTTDIRIGVGVAANITANVVLSMPQFEQGAYSTTFILSPVGATATRVADSFSRNNIFTNGLITSSGGTWFVEMLNNIAYTRDVISQGIGIGDSSTTIENGLLIVNTGTGRQVIQKIISGTPTNLFTTTTDSIKIAIKWNGTTADVFVNGTKQVSATAFAITVMEFLNGNGIGIPRWIKTMALYPSPLSDTDCISLTADYTDGTSIVGDYERYVSQKSGAVENLNGVTNLIQNLK